MHIFSLPFIGYEGHDAPVPIVGERETGLFPSLPQQALLGALPLLELSADTDPLIVVQIVFLFHAVQQQNLIPLQQVAQGGVFHGAFLLSLYCRAV